MLCVDVIGNSFKTRECGYEDLSEVVYALLQIIPRGTLVTYGSIARVLGVSARLVANILKRNPNPIAVPCHKVVMKCLNVGGYTLFGRPARDFKIKLLRLVEGVAIDENGYVDGSSVVDMLDLLINDP